MTVTKQHSLDVLLCISRDDVHMLISLLDDLCLLLHGPVKTGLKFVPFHGHLVDLILQGGDLFLECLDCCLSQN